MEFNPWYELFHDATDEEIVASGVFSKSEIPMLRKHNAYWDQFGINTERK